MIRGSCRPGFASCAVSGAIASHPTNDSISTDAAPPTADQPCGANGAQLAMRAVSAPGHRHDDEDDHEPDQRLDAQLRLVWLNLRL